LLYWAVVLLALVAGFFGFFGIATAAVGIARILFFAFLVSAVVSLVASGTIPIELNEVKRLASEPCAVNYSLPFVTETPFTSGGVQR
jgi:uncharacterized membrane protein YtjA (UPF0391 family)